MISSSTSFGGGLSAADISQLFGPTSAATSSTSAAASPVQSASVGVFVSSASDASKAIQAILVQAQVKHAQSATLGGGSAIGTRVEAAYADQMDSSGALLSESVTTASSVYGRSAATGPWVGLATEAALAVVSASNANELISSTTATWVQERVGPGSTNPWGGGLAVSVPGAAASAADAGRSISTSAASASATFLDRAAYDQIVAGGGSPISLTNVTSAVQTGSSSSLGSASVTLFLPDTEQQVAYAVTEINADAAFTQTMAPPNNEGINAFGGPVHVTEADVVNVTITNGNMTATKGGTLPSGFPSLASVQKAIGQLAASSPQSYPAEIGLDPTTYAGSLTIAKLPPNTNFGCSDNYITFYSNDNWSLDADDKWMLVMPQDTVTATVSMAQTTVAQMPSDNSGKS